MVLSPVILQLFNAGNPSRKRPSAANHVPCISGTKKPPGEVGGFFV
jgi:hypothetical protein